MWSFRLWGICWPEQHYSNNAMWCVRSECSAQALHKNPLQIIMSPCWGFAKHTSINHTNARPGARCPLWPGGHQQPHLAAARRKSLVSVRIFSRHHTVSNPLEPWFSISWNVRTRKSVFKINAVFLERSLTTRWTNLLLHATKVQKAWDMSH